MTHEELRKLAEAATPGKRTLHKCSDGQTGARVKGSIVSGFMAFFGVDTWYHKEQRMEQQSNAEFTAATDPETVIALLDEIDALNKKYQELDLLHEASEGRISELMAEVEQSKRDAERLDYVLKNTAFIHPITFDDTFTRFCLMTQNEDEEYIKLSGDGKTFATEREAIDAAMSAEKGE